MVVHTFNLSTQRQADLEASLFYTSWFQVHFFPTRNDSGSVGYPHMNKTSAGVYETPPIKFTQNATLNV